MFHHNDENNFLKLEHKILCGATSNSVAHKSSDNLYTLFYKKLGSGHSTKSFLISHFSTMNCHVVSNTAADMFLDIYNIRWEEKVFYYVQNIKLLVNITQE